MTSAFIVGLETGYRMGFKEGYIRALTDISEITGLEFKWKDLGNGKYEITVYSQGKLYAKGYAEIHITVEHYRNGKLLSIDHHAGILTDIGKDWIEDQLGDTPSTTPAKYISCSDEDTSSWTNQSSWTSLPGELNANGFTRAEGTYVSTGVGQWNITHTFTATGTQSVRLYGLHWDSTPQSDGNLLCSDTSSVKNLETGDTLKVTWQISVS